MAVAPRYVGGWQEALRVYGQVREILAALGDRSLEISLLNNVGFTYNKLGQPQPPLSFLEEALTLRRGAGDRRGEVVPLDNLGSTWRRLGDPGKALDHHRRALEVATAMGDRRQEMITRLRLGEVE